VSGDPAWTRGSFKLLKASQSGRPALIVVREDLRRSEAPRFPDLVTLRLPLGSTAADGLCSEAESDRLAEVEETLLAALDPAAFRYVGRMTCNGGREVWIYAADGDAAAARLAAALSENGHEGEAESDPDPKWDHYARFT
jgi:hypothetical protein